MKVLVTGATGFVGIHVVSELLQQGYEVIATSLNTSKAEKAPWFSDVIYVPFDISKHYLTSDLFEYFKSPDLLIHLGWEKVNQCEDLIHVEHNLFTHYNFLKNLIGSGLKQVVVVGTCLEYGMKSGCLCEEMIPEPKVSYAIAKDTLRKFLELLKRDYSFNLKWIRLFYMYGQGQHPNSLFAQLDEAILRGDSSFNMSLGEQVRDYLPVETVAQYLAKVAVQNKVAGIINCCSGKPVTVKEMVQQILLNKGSNIKLNLGYYPYRSYEPLAFWGDNSKLLKYLI